MECQHDMCTCTVTEAGDYCSDACAASGHDEISCPCGHRQCSAAQVFTEVEEQL